jgi:aspartyl-tRNA(Asn)/glutamyl-tRNA(Gln) amidotransferase subunit A
VTAAEVAEAVARGEASPVEVVSEALARLEERPELNAVITLCGEQALARAERGVAGRLAGVPLLVKDLIDTAGIRTTYASSIHRDHVPAASAPAVLALEAEGAIVVAKANADEFAWGVAGQNVHWGDMGNPRLPGRIAGGSSGGNAAALAAGAVPLALGTDTGGSVRMPAACCGVVGLKPALGAGSVTGVYPLVPSFDTVGPMARTATDCALAHSLLTGTPVPEPRLEGLAVGVLERLPDVAPPAGEPVADERAWAWARELEAAGARVAAAELPAPEGDIWPLFYAEAAEAHRDTFPSRRDEYGPTIRAKLDMASEVDPAAARRARATLAAWRTTAAREPEVDLLISPTLGVLEVPPADVDELEIRVTFSAYTRVFSFLGWPAIALGDVQLAGRDPAVVIGAALALERSRR